MKAKKRKQRLTHIDSDGRAVMVDVSRKEITVRRAIAESFVKLSRKSLLQEEKGVPPDEPPAPLPRAPPPPEHRGRGSAARDLRTKRISPVSPRADLMPCASLVCDQRREIKGLPTNAQTRAARSRNRAPGGPEM